MKLEGSANKANLPTNAIRLSFKIETNQHQQRLI